MRYAIILARILLGGMFVFFGANFFGKFMDMPKQDYPEAAQQFMAALVPTGYMAAVKFLEIVGGLMVLLGIFVPLGLTILAPIIVNIMFFHIFLMGKADPSGFVPLVLLMFLIGRYWSSFRSLVRVDAPHCAVK
jgi:putative oxidoreductase